VVNNVSNSASGSTHHIRYLLLGIETTFIVLHNNISYAKWSVHADNDTNSLIKPIFKNILIGLSIKNLWKDDSTALEIVL
jgi:hypothetical protein